MDRAGADHHEQAVVLAVEDIANHFTAAGDGPKCGITQRDVLLELIGRDQGLVGGNV
ncbi:hypothetical protein D9M71_535440 [compost metagenome]